MRRRNGAESRFASKAKCLHFCKMLVGERPPQPPPCTHGAPCGCAFLRNTSIIFGFAGKKCPVPAAVWCPNSSESFRAQSKEGAFHPAPVCNRRRPAAFGHGAYKREKQLSFCQRDKEKHQRLPVLSIHFYMIHFTTDAGWPQGVFGGVVAVWLGYLLDWWQLNFNRTIIFSIG